MRSLDIGASGMLAQQMNVDTISNNIANMTTTGFKRQRIEFADLMYQHLSRPGSSASSAGDTVPSGISLGLGVRPAATYRIHEQGTILITEGDLDIAINGKGFLQVQLPNGTTAYTRAGSLQRNENGALVTNEGYPITPAITIPNNATSIEISPDGEVLASVPGQTAPSNLGQIQLAAFINPSGLEAMGDNLFLETQASGAPVTGNPNEEDFGKLQQHMLESSNVDAVKEVTSLITAQRAYEMNSKIISTSDEMMQSVSQLR